jgi:hypothetical protein
MCRRPRRSNRLVGGGGGHALCARLRLPATDGSVRGTVRQGAGVTQPADPREALSNVHSLLCRAGAPSATIRHARRRSSPGRRAGTPAAWPRGEVAERLNAAVSKTVVPRKRYRGFESPPLRIVLPRQTTEGLPARSEGIPNPRGRERKRESPFGLSSSERSELSRTARRGRQLAKQDARIPPSPLRKAKNGVSRPGSNGRVFASFGPVRGQLGSCKPQPRNGLRRT